MISADMKTIQALGPMRAILVAAVAAIAVEPVAFLILFVLPQILAVGGIPLSQALGVSLFAALFATPFVVLIGIPAFMVLRRLKCLSWLSLGAVGFFSAALLPTLSLLVFGSCPGCSSGGMWHGRYVDFVINGETTFYGWLSHAESSIFFGLHGLAGALAFYFVWRRLGPNNSFKPKPRSGSA